MFLLLTPYAQALSGVHTLPDIKISTAFPPYLWAFLLIFFYQFFNDVAWGAYVPLFGESIPVRQRGIVSGIQQVFGGFGAFFLLAFGLGIPRWASPIRYR